MKKYTPKRKWPKLLLAAVVAVGLGVAGWYGWQWYTAQRAAENTAREENDRQNSTRPQKSIEERFVERYYEVNLPGVKRIDTPPEITGHEAADNHIRDLARERGYRLQFTPTRPLQDFGGEKLQPKAIQAWEQLKQAAQKEGIALGLVSGHRSIRTQQIIFDSQLRQRAEEKQDEPFTAGQIISGEADKVINTVLQEYSIPGYSKHHSGYTIDINDMVANQSLDEFGQTEAYTWLSANNYTKAREFGFLPSYPEGADDLGPEAELWEYVWVGSDNTDF